MAIDTDFGDVRRSLEEALDRVHASAVTFGVRIPNEVVLERYKAFVDLVYHLSAGGPPLPDLHACIADGRINNDDVPGNVAAMLYGFPCAETWDAPAPDIG